MSMHEIRRIGVVPGSICRTWLKAVPNDDQEYPNFNAWGNMLDRDSNIIWHNIDLTAATEEFPIDQVLDGVDGVYSILVDALFSVSNGSGLLVTNEIYSEDVDGNFVSHGRSESRLLVPTADNALRWVSIYIKMAGA